jgi:uncharacterized protein (DUF2147 family)
MDAIVSLSPPEQGEIMKQYIGAAALIFGLGVAAEASTPIGNWVTQDGKGRIRVAKCGEGLCGNLTWFRMPPESAHVPLADVLDSKNANAALRGRKLLGSPVLVNMQAQGQATWKGHIYNADDGRIYDATISLSGPNSLKVQGCALGGWVCGTQSWSRIQ